MRLTSIKLAGFKSFVDPVTVPFDGNMTAIVGPNGCGKSNIIDAVRWVMGESSAKTLRGESMADVIFNGSVGRRPVGQASIELRFDNRDGDMGGMYAQYAEIAVKRVVTRDGQSSYFFNGQKCRRRDIADLFMGTGLGPRSYAIIGQGMISRLIEARPEELRATLEEAAGISKYKERRRETENRMRRTQENLERLDDIREELDKQLERLRRQAEAAKRYQALKQQEQCLQGELALLRGCALRAQQSAQESHVRDLETAVERELLGARQCESRLEEARLEHDGLSEHLETSQARFYETTTAIARLEQQLEHARSRAQQLNRELASAQRELAELDRLGDADGLRLAELDEQLETLGPAREEVVEQLEVLEAALDQAEQQQHEANQRWESFTEEHRDASRDAERAQERIANLERRLEALAIDLERRRRQQAELADAAELRDQRSEIIERLAELDMEQQTLSEQCESQRQRRDAARRQSDTAEARRETLRQQRSQWQGELASLNALITAALEDNSESLSAHLNSYGLDETPRLGECLVVESGWEETVSWVLAPWLNARLVALVDAEEALSSLAEGELTLLDINEMASGSAEGSLAARVQGAGPCQALLMNIMIAESSAEAWRRYPDLAPGQSLITRDGLWLGRGWARRRASLRSDGKSESGDSLLINRRRRDELAERLATLTAELDELDARVDEARDIARHAEEALEASREPEAELQRRRQQRAREEASLAARLDHIESRCQELDEEQAQLAESRESGLLELEEARETWQQAMVHLEQSSAARDAIERQRSEATAQLESLRTRQRPLNERGQQLALDLQRLTTERAGLLQQRGRSEEGRARLAHKCLELAASCEALDEPEEIERERLEMLFEQRERHEQALNACRDQAAEISERLRQDELERQRHERNLEGVRERLQEARLQVQAFKLKADAQDEQLNELGLDVAELAEHLDADATESAWQARLENLGEKIRRLGAINLAAIEEYDQQAERRDYLQAQHSELCEALETLERAIRKIDQETRIRFKQTFERVDAGLQTLFPKVFGGGAAWLTLTGEDLLETGVAIMARPPGKKNSTIHLLSGGEKALTALSLVFAIFQLNPAPFCMLDEVDAPLDDANVGRYAALVKDMSKTVQFIYITHNKIAMEAAERLMGVTMQEPGVSRLVSVGVEEAVVLADA